MNMNKPYGTVELVLAGKSDHRNDLVTSADESIVMDILESLRT